MLQTIQEFARERLSESGELPMVQQALRVMLVALVADADRGLDGVGLPAWLARLASEQPSIRAELGRALVAGDGETALRLSGGMARPTGFESEIEIRPFFEADDFGDALTPELRAQEDRLRARLTEQQGS